MRRIGLAVSVGVLVIGLAVVVFFGRAPRYEPISLGDLQELDESQVNSIAKILEGAEIVGFGEATHGSKTIYESRRLLLRALVEHFNFDVLAIEAGVAQSFRSGDFVRGDADNVDLAMSDFTYWITQHDQLKRTLEWMRQWNEGEEGQQISFFGFDTNSTSVAARYLLNGLSGSDILSEAMPVLEAFESGRRAAGYPIVDPLTKEDAHNVLEALYRSIGDSSQTTLAVPKERLLDAAKMLVQLSELYLLPSGEGNLKRDEFMADNVLRIRERLGSGTKIVLWAHNSHIAADHGSHGGPSMGTFLKKALGDRYVAIGTFFGRGAFTAFDRKSREKTVFNVGAPPSRSPEEYLVGAPPSRFAEEYLENRLAHLLDGNALVVFSSNELLRFRDIGAVYSEREAARTEAYDRVGVVRRSFDAIVYLPTSEPLQIWAKTKRDL